MGGFQFRRQVQDGPRVVFINGGALNQAYPDNRISNTKYSILTFLPKNLWEQFGRFMNIYFVLIGTLQLFPTIAPVNPLTTWVPLIFIFTLSALKEAIDDYYRYRQDKQANEREIQCQHVHVGDLLFIEEDDQLPADVVILKTSEENGGCYITTANLDGETDFKPRKAVRETMNLSEDVLSRFDGVIECAVPNREIYKFDSRLRMSQYDTKNLPLDNSNTALQATTLKNAKWVIGAVVYTGNQTKIGMNKTTPPTKWTRLDKYINRATLAIFGFQLFLVVLFGIFGNVWRMNYAPSLWYIADDTIQPIDYIIIPLRFLLLMSLMIPISLKVTMDVVKYVYALLIDWDMELMDHETETPANANTTAISEDLGQIEYVFTDKTGTLTENIMAFSKCSINGKLYGNSSQYATALDDPRLHADVDSSDPHVWQFFRALALCNTVVPTVESSIDVDTLVYKSSSPDEEALVKAARDAKFTFRERKLTTLVMEAPDLTLEKFEVLNVLEFSSDRKRMSVLLQEYETKKLYLYIKGADDKIIPLLSTGNAKNISDHLEAFARAGLRTLCIAFREVSQAEYDQWKPSFDNAASSLKNREELLAESYAALENNFTYLGVTAIEDKLQEGVPEAIVKLRAAGIRVWMLTGDKYTTAIQIATSCNLIDGEPDTLLTVSGVDEFEVRSSISTHLEHIKKHGHSKTMSVIIEGAPLHIALHDAKEDFLELTLAAHTVICCRVTPHQKALVVTMVKNEDKATLAIGDGGNDVSMIQEACVGVGIRGREGLQAARASDFSIGKFRYLVRLLLVHGRYSYKKTAFVALYCFHKSLFIAFIQLAFAMFSGYSGTSFFDSFMLATYNAIFTGLPIMFYSLDKDVSEDNLMNNPSLYQETQRGAFMNWKWLLYWFVRSFLQSAMVFACVVLIFGPQSYTQPDGQPMDFACMSAITYGICITIQTLTILVESNNLTFLNHLAIWGTMAAYYAFMLLLNAVAPFLQSVMYRLFSDPNWWFGLILSTVISFGPFMAIKYITFNYTPMKYQLVQYMESLDSEEFAKLRNGAGSSIVIKRWASSGNSDIGETESGLSSPLIASSESVHDYASFSSIDDAFNASPVIKYDGPDKLSVTPLSEIRKKHKQKSKMRPKKQQ